MTKQQKYKVCKNCKFIYTEKSQCPLCNNSQHTNIWRGVIYVVNHNKSYVSKKLNFHDNGLFALRVK